MTAFMGVNEISITAQRGIDMFKVTIKTQINVLAVLRINSKHTRATSLILVRGCLIITSRIGGGWVSALFVMLCDWKQSGEWCFMKGRNVTVKKS